MRAYSVVVSDGRFPPTFVGSEVEARQFRMKLMEAEGLKRKEIEVNLVEIPTTKAELIEWLNKQSK